MPSRDKGIVNGSGHSFDDYQSEEVEEKVGVVADDVEGLAAEVDEFVELLGGAVAPVDHVRHVRGEDERGSVAVEARL
jgi:hypothetical protein